MNINRKSAPSDAGKQLLESLRQSVAEALEKKRRLGQYAVIWENGATVLKGEDAPQANNTEHKRERA